MSKTTHSQLACSFLQDGAADWCSGALFSECRTWRYGLWRRWDWPRCRMVAFVGLNPSTADESSDDPTIRRCKNFAKAWGFDGMYMLNAYAFRATDPQDMKVASDPVGPDNDRWLHRYGNIAEFVIAAWGVHCEPNRERSVCETIGKPVMCLGRTQAGRPKHPLYLRADTQPEPFWQPTEFLNPRPQA